MIARSFTRIVGDASILSSRRPAATPNQAFQCEPRTTLQKLPRWKFGSLSAITSAITLANAVSGLCLTPLQVAAKCGFSSVDTLRRAFMRVVGVTPADYRKRHAMPAH